VAIIAVVVWLLLHRAPNIGLDPSTDAPFRPAPSATTSAPLFDQALPHTADPTPPPPPGPEPKPQEPKP
jgi:hypothetical protein